MAIFQRVDYVRLFKSVMREDSGHFLFPKLEEPNLILELFLQHFSSDWAKLSEVVFTMNNRRDSHLASLACVWLTHALH